jgi:hypothetical protein
MEDAGAEPPSAFHRASQNLVAATILLRRMPEPSTTEGHRIHGEVRGLLECARGQQTETLHLGFGSLPWNGEQVPLAKRGRPWSILSPQRMKPPWSETASSTIFRTMMSMTASASGYTTRTDVMPRTASILGGVVAMIVGKIEAPRSSL